MTEKQIEARMDEIEAGKMMMRPKVEAAVIAILVELARAEKSCHPTWPTETLHQVAIMAGESGEALQAALHLVEGRGSLDAVRNEVIQAGAMAIRALINFDEGEVRDE